MAFADFERRIVHRVINDMVPWLHDAEVDRALSKPVCSMTAYDRTMQALAAMEVLSRESFDRADALLAEARRLDPGYAAAFAWSARLNSIRVGQGWTRDRLVTSRIAITFARRAIKLDPGNAVALATAGHLQSFLRQNYTRGRILIASAIEACPNSPLAWSLACPTLTYLGDPQAGYEHAQHALWLSPRDPHVYQFYGFLGLSCYALGKYEAAVNWTEKSLAENPIYTATIKYRIAALVGMGEVAAARELKPALLQLEPKFGAGGEISSPFRDATSQELYRTQMRTAGF